MHPKNFSCALETLAGLQINISDLITILLSLSDTESDPLCLNAFSDIASNYLSILDGFKSNKILLPAVQSWIHQCTINNVVQESNQLTKPSTGWHGHAQSARIDQFESKNVDDIAQTAKNLAPCLWSIFDSLLMIEGRLGTAKAVMDDQSMEEGTQDVSHGATIHTGSVGHNATKLRELRIVNFITTIARLRNQKCNALATHFGLFLHASGSSKRVIDTLSQIGLSTSTTSIDRTVSSLSNEAYNGIRLAGQSLKYLLAYDNLVIDFGTPGQSTVEKSQRSLWNLTTGTFINHDYNPEDLRCADEVRKRDPYNDREDHEDRVYDYYDLLVEGSLDSDNLNQHHRFFAWTLLNVVCTHGPAFFHQFRSRIGDPEVIEQIPIKKTDQVPVRAMQHDNSKVSGNINALEDMMKQGGIRRHSPDEEPTPGEPQNLSEYVLLVSGDLGTGERIDTARRRRAMDICVWNTLYYVIFIPGMFHVKMALVDMLWKLFIKPFAQENDPTSASNATNYLCPVAKDANKILKGPPTYQQMKRFLKHLGVAERLTCWRTAFENRFGPSIWSDLDNPAFVARFTLEFTWNDLVALSKDLVKTFFSLKTLEARQENPDQLTRDKELENTMLRNYYMLMYEETIYAMDWGDIGRLERCLIDWIPAFRAVGKHKYAYHLTTFFLDVRFHYPDRLSKAVRRSVLCNLSGRPGKFQGNDWVVELDNLYTKVIYGGKGSNRTLERILKESPLIQVYRNVMTSIESLFLLGPGSVRHQEPDMRQTYSAMVRELDKNGLFRESSGRTTKKEIINAFAKGHEIFIRNGFKWDFDEDEDDPGSIAHYDEDDLNNGIDLD